MNPIDPISTAQNSSLAHRVASALRVIPDYPKAGIRFQDITPVLGDAGLFREVIQELGRPFRGIVTHVVGIEARGFIFGGAVAVNLGAAFVPVRKPGKLPWELVREEYALEYGTDVLEAHSDAVRHLSKVLIVDDVLATGGTARAAGQIVRRLGGEVLGWAFLLEIAGLGGRAKLDGSCQVVVSV